MNVKGYGGFRISFISCIFLSHLNYHITNATTNFHLLYRYLFTANINRLLVLCVTPEQIDTRFVKQLNYNIHELTSILYLLTFA